jgi:hypothetical protein
VPLLSTATSLGNDVPVVMAKPGTLEAVIGKL